MWAATPPPTVLGFRTATGSSPFPPASSMTTSRPLPRSSALPFASGTRSSPRPPDGCAPPARASVGRWTARRLSAGQRKLVGRLGGEPGIHGRGGDDDRAAKAPWLARGIERAAIGVAENQLSQRHTLGADGAGPADAIDHGHDLG